MDPNQHSPAPWTVGHSKPGQTCVWVGGAIEGAHNMGPDMSWIDCNTPGNARLVAAAPDLLGALHRILGAYERLKEPGYPQSDAEKQARAAIAKATGKS